MADMASLEATDRKAGTGVLVAACVSAFVVNANTSAVTILLPAISEDLGAPIDQLQWAVTGYMLVGAAVIVTAGALGDVLGRRRVFLAGLLLFVASCVLIALVDSGAGVIAGRMIQGAAGSTILACGMSLLSVDASGAGQMKAITLWGAASAAGAAAGPLVGGVLVEATGWQGLFWIDAAIAALCIPITIATVRESRDPHRSRSIDWLGTALIAVILVPLVLALSEGTSWGWLSVATVSCFVVSVLGAVGFVKVEQRVEAPIVDLQLLRNRVLVGSTLAILIVAGALNALMYLLSLYFQDPSTFGMSPLDAGLATLPAAAAMILVTPLITPLAVKIGSRQAVGLGFILGAVGSALLILVDAVVGVPRLRDPAHPDGGGARTRERPGVVRFHLGGVRRPGRCRVGDLEHGAIHRRVARGRRGRDRLRLGDHAPTRRRRQPDRRARFRAVEGCVAARADVRCRRPSRGVDGPSSCPETSSGPSRRRGGGGDAHDPDRAGHELLHRSIRPG